VELNFHTRYEDDYNWGLVFLIVVGFAAIFVIFIFFYKGSLKRDLTKEMSLQMHQMISEYAAFKEKNVVDTSNI